MTNPKKPIDFNAVSKQIRKKRGALFKRWADRQLSEWNRTHSEALEILDAIENDMALSRKMKDAYEEKFAKRYRSLMKESEVIIKSLLDSVAKGGAGKIKRFRKKSEP
jgi:hypothetical protein